jgi:hypothetical protein
VTPDQVVTEWRTADSPRQYQLRQEAHAVACPRPDCEAQPEEWCSYSGAKIDNETGQIIGMQRITRSAHLERLAVFTGGRLYGYTLHALERRQSYRPERDR